ncbi:MAG: serine/threonine protein phosphatase [Acidimicrobiaceae bacterium]|nr:serine/threonine protein phosphatase [Acidimicrobiaceae bacterium]
MSADLVAVADGMGGHVGGEIAARVAIDTLRRSFAEDRTAQGLVAATMQANRAVFDQSEREPNLRGMGTTLTAAALVRAGKAERLVLSNVGDSRAYLLQDGRLAQLTEDHSLVEEMVRNGELSPAEAAVHPHRHILTRALGIDRSVNVDSWELEPTTDARLLLCSDGLTNECSDEEIASVLTSSPDPADAAKKLVALALDHGGSDNVTVVVVDLDKTAPSPADMASSGRRSKTSGSAPSTGTARGVTAASAATAGLTVPMRAQSATTARRAQRDTRTRRQPVVAPDRTPRRRADRVLSLRVIVFVVLFVGVLGGAAGAVGWYVKASYFVGIDHGYVAVFEGRPGGFLWFKPAVLDKTTLPVSKVFAPNIPPLRAGMLERSYAAAEAIVSNLTNEHHSLALPTVDTSGALGVVGTTTTTVPPTTTTTKPPTKAPGKKAKKTSTTANTATTG